MIVPFLGSKATRSASKSLTILNAALSVLWVLNFPDQPISLRNVTAPKDFDADIMCRTYPKKITYAHCMQRRLSVPVTLSEGEFAT